MHRLRLEDLYRIKGDLRRATALDGVRLKVRITVHMGTCGISSGADRVHAALARALETARRSDIRLTTSGCAGLCNREPLITVEHFGQQPIKYADLTPEKALDIFQRHVLEGRIVTEWAFSRGFEQTELEAEGLGPPPAGGPAHIREMPFFGQQQLCVMRNRGLIQADRIDEAIARDGYFAAAKALYQMTAREIIQEVKASGIRGRGGGGFPTGLKWEFAAHSPGPVKYVLCNADEGDPGAFMDRCVLESDPHSVIEGMIIAAKAIGASRGYIYCRAEYPLAVRTLNLAIGQARTCGLLGEDILGSGFDFDLEVYRGAGAFVCGEETALMTSIEGRRGNPRPRPPFPAVEGLWRKPTILNNVETLANIPQIVLNGGRWYAALGTQRSRGTKVFALTGDVRHVGLVEVPMGVPLGKIIYDIGGGIPSGRRFKAVQLGGPSGGCIPASHLNAPVDYETIVRLGAIVGSGGMIVMDENKCVVDVARFFMDFCREESCGKCAPCRVGTRKMLDILTRICHGQGRPEDLQTLEYWAEVVQNTSLCGLGQTAPNPVLSTLRYFRAEYEAHILERRCPAVVCGALFKAPCQHACPIGMDIPAYVALVRAGRLDDAYAVLLRTNPFPSVCGRVCDHACEAKCRRQTLDAPVHIKALKRFITDHARPPAAPAPAPRRDAPVAVIGAGPAGLTAARDLVMRGYPVTVFEELPEAGGMLRWGIPEYRLPRKILAAEIQAIVDLGVTLSCRTRVGRDISWDTLRNQYDAVYLAIGAQKSVPADFEGQDLKGITGAVEFLRELHLGGRPYVGRRVVVVGGGNSAIDAAQCALRLGAETVDLVYRRTRADMPALVEEVAAAEKEGVRLQFLLAPLRFEAEGRHVARMICQRMTLGEFDASGRRKPVPILGSTMVMAADQVILAIGQLLDAPCDLPGAGLALTAGGWIEIAPGSHSRTTSPMVFAGGDAVTGPHTVVGAIAAGHRAAAEIDDAIRQVRGEPPWMEPDPLPMEIPRQIDSEIPATPRAELPEAETGERIRDFREIGLGLDPAAALAEACRCLGCDLEPN